MAKKVLILSMMYYPRVGGAEVALRQITDRIPTDDIEFHMVTIGADPDLPKKEQVGNVLVHRVSFFSKRNPQPEDYVRFPLFLNKWLFQGLGALKALQLHRRHQYDTVWAMMANGAGVPAMFVKLLHPNVRFILTLQEGKTYKEIKRKVMAVYPLFVLVFRKADVIQAISNYLAGFATHMGYKRDVVVIPNGVDIKRFARAPDALKRLRLRKQLSVNDKDTLLITTSRLTDKNAVDDVIRALSKLPEHVIFAVLGTGPDEQMLRELAVTEGVSERVRFVGFVPYEEIPAYLHASDIFVRPSRAEGMGNSFIEAMAAGLPVIATQEGGIVDFLFDAKNDPDKPTTGWAVPKDDPDAIVQAVGDIISHPEQVQKVREHAHVFIAGTYEWDTVAHRMREEVFRDTA